MKTIDERCEEYEAYYAEWCNDIEAGISGLTVEFRRHLEEAVADERERCAQLVETTYVRYQTSEAYAEAIRKGGPDA